MSSYRLSRKGTAEEYDSLVLDVEERLSWRIKPKVSYLIKIRVSLSDMHLLDSFSAVHKPLSVSEEYFNAAIVDALGVFYSDDFDVNGFILGVEFLFITNLEKALFFETEINIIEHPLAKESDCDHAVDLNTDGIYGYFTPNSNEFHSCRVNLDGYLRFIKATNSSVVRPARLAQNTHQIFGDEVRYAYIFSLYNFDL